MYAGAILVADTLSARVAALVPTEACAARGAAIFGTGDALNLVTATSNRRFVHAARCQGVGLFVFEHDA